MPPLKILSVAINQKRMGYVLLVNQQLKDWRTMTKATESRAEAAAALQRLINDFRPDVVVTERVDAADCRSAFVCGLKQALTRTAAQNYVLDVSVRRRSSHANKYAEANALADLYPELRPWVPPPRRAFDHQPPRLIIFDALALAQPVLENPTITLAAAMS